MNTVWIKEKGIKFGTLVLYTDKAPFTKRKHFCEVSKKKALERAKLWLK